jgi:hypothetical protein
VLEQLETAARVALRERNWATLAALQPVIDAEVAREAAADREAAAREAAAARQAAAREAEPVRLEVVRSQREGGR